MTYGIGLQLKKLVIYITKGYKYLIMFRSIPWTLKKLLKLILSQIANRVSPLIVYDAAASQWNIALHSAK